MTTLVKGSLRRFIHHALWMSSIGVALAIMSVGLFTLSRYLDFNNGVVVPGELYRAGQMNPREMEYEVHLYHIRSVVNLRGSNPKNAWYSDEVAVCHRLGVAHADVRMGARHLPPPDEVKELLEVYHQLPRPILVHCNSGADRSGLASSIYLMDQKGISPTAAARELSVHFGHLAIFPYFEMNEFLDLYGEENPNRRKFSQWALQDYPGVFQAESRETTWDEIMEPFESLARIQYWRHK